MEGMRGTETQLMIKGEFPFLTVDATSEQVWKHFYHLATLFAKSKELAPSLNCFIDVFLIRGNEMHNPDKDWLDFFRRQFSIYLMGKKCISCSLSEGDMIHDFLRMEYEQIKEELQNSEFAFQKENLSRWFASLELDFPWLVESEELHWSFG